MLKKPSVRSYLSLAYSMFLFLVLLLGLFSIERLRHFNAISTETRDLWLKKTRLLGELDNLISDFRTAEASHIISARPAEIQSRDREIKALDLSIARIRSSYENINHSQEETLLYAHFLARWKEYDVTSEQTRALSRTKRKPAAREAYLATSQSAYDAVNAALEQLIELNVAKAHLANEMSDSSYRRSLMLISVAIVLAGLMMTATVLYVRQTILKPLLSLAGNMLQLSTNETAVDIRGTERTDEIGEVARSVVVFRNNAVELTHAQRELTLMVSVLDEKLDGEQRLRAMQRNFISMVSHEFRTPLTIIDGHAQRIVKTRDCATSDDIAQRVGKIRSEVTRINDLIENLLDSSRLSDGGIEGAVNPNRIDLTLLMRDVCNSYRDAVQGFQILSDLGESPVFLSGDPALLHLAFSNLISNGIKYSKGVNLITVNANVESGFVHIRIQDWGIGIPLRDQQRLFERYYRASNAAGIKGTGIGLHLAGKIFELHGGDIAVESTEGEGSLFTVRLPQHSCRQREA